MAQNEVTTIVGSPNQILFRDSTDFNPTAANDLRVGSQTAVQLDLTSVADNAFRQSAKVDLSANRGSAYSVMAAFEFAATPTTGEYVNLHWLPSPETTATDGNPAGASGSDAAYTGYSTNPADSIKQAILLGTFITTNQATGTVQVAYIGTFSPSERYGILIIENQSGAAFHSDMVESHIVFTPISQEIE